MPDAFMAASADGGVSRYGGRYAGRVGYGGYRGGYYRRGLAYGAVGAAAAYGAYGYGNRGGCYYSNTPSPSLHQSQDREIAWS
jgi:hypothetical protein